MAVLFEFQSGNHCSVGPWMHAVSNPLISTVFYKNRSK